MDQKEAKVVEQVFRKLLDLETARRDFTEIDDYMDILSSLESDQLCKEAAVLLAEHKTGHIIPDFNIPNPPLLTPMIIESVGYILTTYDAVGMLMSSKHRYILEMYLALQQSSKFAALKKRK